MIGLHLSMQTKQRW